VCVAGRSAAPCGSALYRMQQLLHAPPSSSPLAARALKPPSPPSLPPRPPRIDEQIKQCDEKLMAFREQLKKTRPGPAQDALKRRAMTVLKQKKMFEGQRETLYNQQFNMEQTRFTVESIQDTVQTVQVRSVSWPALSAAEAAWFRSVVECGCSFHVGRSACMASAHVCLPAGLAADAHNNIPPPISKPPPTRRSRGPPRR
jgi:hypothetical protein